MQRFNNYDCKPIIDRDDAADFVMQSRNNYPNSFAMYSPLMAPNNVNLNYIQAKNDDKIKFPKTNEQLAEDIWEKDFKKLNNLIKKEFHTKIIWENDFRNKPNEIVEECYQWIMKLNQLNQLKE